MSHHKAEQNGQWLKVLGNTIMGKHSMAELALFSDHRFQLVVWYQQSKPADQR